VDWFRYYQDKPANNAGMSAWSHSKKELNPVE
jgi:hypothetical protein